MPYKDREQQLKYWRRYYYRNRKHKLRYHQDYYRRNKEKMHAASARWAAAHPEKRKKIALDHYYRNQTRYSDYRRLKRTGCSPEQYQQLLEVQQGRCAICHEHMAKPFVDHNHKTKVVRGLLCHQCNVGIGNLRDDISLLESAISYLRNAECR